MPTNTYIVNISALHNYQHIKAVILQPIHNQIHAPFTRDHTAAQLHATNLLQ